MSLIVSFPFFLFPINFKTSLVKSLPEGGEKLEKQKSLKINFVANDAGTIYCSTVDYPW